MPDQTADIMSLDEFRNSSTFGFGKSTWHLSYHDKMHLGQDRFVTLGKIEIDDVNSQGHVFFRFNMQPNELLAGGKQDAQDPNYVSLFAAWTGGDAKDRIDGVKDDKMSHPCNAAASIIQDQVSTAMVRLGLVAPRFDIYPKFDKSRRYVITVLDTSVLKMGILRSLMEIYDDIRIWAIIPTVSLMEIGERMANITSEVRKGNCKVDNYKLLKWRSQATVIPQEINWIKENLPNETLELSPELVVSFRGYKDQDTERLSVNDRLILEGIKDIRRQRNLSDNIYLMSADKDMARLARLDGINVIFPSVPPLPDGEIYSLRYSAEAQKYITCSLHHFLWDFTHIFSRIRISCESGVQAGQIVELFYYYPTKEVNDWYVDKLEVKRIGSGAASPTV